MAKRASFPTGWSGILKKSPRVARMRKPKGVVEVRGTRISKYGLTPEERLASYAPEGTTPERMVFGWLAQHEYLFEFQVPVLGGRVPGGAVVDFIIYDRQPNIALRVMSWWHQSAEAQWADSIQYDMLINYGYQVEDVWEYEVNTVRKVDQKMREILFGTPRFSSSTDYVSTSGGACPICGDPCCVKCSW